MAKLVKNCLKNGQKFFSRPKKGPKSGFRPRKKYQPNWSKNGQNKAKRYFLGLKSVQKVVLGPEKFLDQISQKMAKSCFLGLKG